jgi:hypothetical protein
MGYNHWIQNIMFCDLNFGYMMKDGANQKRNGSRTSSSKKTHTNTIPLWKGNVWELKGNNLGIPRMNFHFGSWESQGVSQLWDKNADDKQCPNWALNVSLERSQNLNIESELAFSIWSCEIWVMAKMKVENFWLPIITWKSKYKKISKVHGNQDKLWQMQT